MKFGMKKRAKAYEIAGDEYTEREKGENRGGKMALTNFILTVAGVSAAILLIRSDVRHSGAMFRRNIRQIRNWLEEESLSSSSKSAEKVKPKQVDGQVNQKDVPKDN